MSHGTPFSPEGIVSARVRWAGHKDPRLGWGIQDHEVIFDEADGVYEHDGDPMLLVGEARPIGRVLARARAGKHGIAQFLSSDAMFTRFERGLVWVMDRKAKSRSARPQRIQIGFGKQNSGSGQVEAGPDGRRPWIDPFIEFVPITGVSRKNITVMMPEERKLQNPYGIVLRGSSFGIDGDLADNFFFPEDHHHITDHRGPGTGLAKPNDRRSTRWYDVNQGGAPSVDIRDKNGRVTERGYNQNTDRIIVVHRDAGGCAGGDPEDMNLAFNFSGRTGFAHGLCEFQATAPAPAKPEPPKSPGRTAATKPGEDNEDTYATARAGAVLATIAKTRGGPFTPGNPKADKHKYATNKDGIPYNCVHIDINAKFTNDSIIFDGRRNMVAVFEPPVGQGVLPIRCFEQFNPKLSDPYFCGAKIGGWDFHTKVNSIPWYPTDPPPRDPEDPPPRDPEDPPPTEPPGVPSFLPFIDWGPLETVRPSEEVQPRPGNTETPSSGHGNKPDDRTTEATPRQDQNPDSTAEDVNFAQMQRDRVGLTQMDLSTIAIAGVPYCDHVRSPRTLHKVGFYKHKYDSPRDSHTRALLRNPPEYTVPAKYVEGVDMSNPRKLQLGSAAGLTMYAPIELRSWEMRHDIELPASLALSPQTIGLYPGVKLAFGFAGTFWDRIADGFEIYQGVHPLDGNENNALIFDCVNADGEHDGDKILDIRNPALNNNVLRPVVFNAGNFTATAGTDHMVDTKTGGAPIVATLPAASASPTGTIIRIKDDGGGAGEFLISVVPTGPDTIDGRVNTNLRSDWESVAFENTGSSWRMIARNTMGPRLALETTAITMVADEDLFYVFRGATILTPLLPASPTQGDQVRVKSFSTTKKKLNIGRNGNTIESLASDFRLKYGESATFTWIEADTTWIVS